ncbi:MAG TPA: hypothetical protein VMR45_05270 [Patescibacteria group bacterium]|nr:hypothetical protein [Patescibacteria group bacterium]
MIEVAFDLLSVRPYEPEKETPIGYIRGMHADNKSVISWEEDQERPPYTLLESHLPREVAKRAMEFLRRNNIYVPPIPQEELKREDLPFNCITFAADAVFRVLDPEIRERVCNSMVNERYVAPSEFKEISDSELKKMKPGAMYGVVGSIRSYLFHAFVGLPEEDRHLTVIGYNGDYTVDSTPRILAEFNDDLMMPCRVVRFDDLPRLCQ